ncbi:MAG: Flp pilus assembly protein CpaB [Nocardioides sp.]
MSRRKVLLTTAAVVALLGVALVFLYVRGADNRAEERFETIEVLTAVAPIEAGESIDDAATAGKLALQPVAQDDLLPNYQTTTEDIAGMVATAPIYTGEQIISDKFGAGAEAARANSPLQLPEGTLAVSVNLTDTARVAGFINPGSEVGVWLNGTAPQPFTRVLLPKVTVIAVGSTTTTTKTTTTANGEQTTEQLPKTLLTLALPQKDAEKVLFAQGNGELVLGVLGETPVKPGPGVTAADLFR